MRWLALVLLSSCAPEVLPLPGHVVVFIDTDAPLPSAPGETRADFAPMPLFDRLRLEVFPADASTPCDGCTRELAIDERTIREGASLVVREETVTGAARLRARLLRSGPGGLVQPVSTLDVWSTIPERPDAGAREVTVWLGTDGVGRTLGSAQAPLAPLEGAPAPSKVGTWADAQRVPCAGAPRAGEVCVPGGAYWIGSTQQVLDQTFALSEHLVVLSPFFLGAHEVTVAELRDAGFIEQVERWEGDFGGRFTDEWCSASASADAGREGLPANCIDRDVARAYCVSKGGDLPTEAQWEYVAGALQSRSFPWGETPPACGEVVFGLGGFGRYASTAGPCRPDGGFGGPRAWTPATAGRDRVALPGGEVFDLVGNLAEWVLDAFTVENDTNSCWPGLPRRDPLCVIDDAPIFLIRGGSWLDDGKNTATRLDSHKRLPDLRATPTTGFRCARPGR